MQIDQSKIEAAIIERAVDEIVTSDFVDQVLSRVNKTVEARINTIFVQTADQQIKSAVETAIRDGFDREYTAIDSFGRPVGEPTTIAKQLERIISDFWKTQVGRDGKPTSYGGTSRAEYVMGQILAGDFKKIIEQTIVNSSAKFKDAFRDAMHREINAFLNSIIRVNSLGDQAMKESRMDSTVPYGSPEAKG